MSIMDCVNQYWEKQDSEDAKKNVVVGGDELLPILIFVIIKGITQDFLVK